MKKGDLSPRARKSLVLRPEFLVLGLLAEGPAHGYELFHRFLESLGVLWHISESQFYATVKRIEARGWINAWSPAHGRGGSKRLLSLSQEGRRMLFEWVDAPTIGSPRLVHLEFLTRLHFARRLVPQKFNRIVADQKASLEKDFHRISDRRERGSAKNELEVLSVSFRECQLRAAIEWIEKGVAPVFSGGRTRSP